MAINPFEFLQQVRSEASKVVWPTRRETMVTTGMVMLMVVFASLFFLVVDEVLRHRGRPGARHRPRGLGAVRARLGAAPRSPASTLRNVSGTPT